jgi:3-(methylthio)propanoyl-CoA dehydrogenase
VDEAIDNYHRILDIVGEISAEVIAPNAEEVDAEGNTLNEDGTVTYHPLLREPEAAVAGRLDGLHPALPVRRLELPQPDLHRRHRDRQPRRRFAAEHLRVARDRRDDQCLCQREIKCEYLPRFSVGEVTGAMVLTEPDAGSDLQAIRLRADLDDQGVWRLNGVKRFITNGCGEVLLTLARSEHAISDGRGLSLFVSERTEHIKVRHLEKKLGIHGSPTCELVYTNAPARLVGERQRG